MDEKNKNWIIWALSVGCMYMAYGGSFGSFGSAVDEKNEKWIIWALSVGCMYVVARLARLARQWIKKTRNELFER